MARYLDDGMTVTVFVNLDSDHARPVPIARVVAGLVLPTLMPALAKPLADDPKRARQLRDFLKRAAAGQDVTGDYDPAAGHKVDPLESRELAAMLPQGWQDAPMTLVNRADIRNMVRYDYRIGPAANTRLLSVALMPSGRLAAYRVSPDPDAR